MHDAALFAKLKTHTVEDANGCWIWQRSFGTGGGYGQVYFHLTKKPASAHRVMWYAVHGEWFKWSEGIFLCHTCDIRACINPAHLWKGTQQENMQDMSAKGRSYWSNQTHCVNGHEFTPENTYQGKKQRACRACANEIQAIYRAQKRNSISESGGIEPLTPAKRAEIGVLLLRGVSVADVARQTRQHYNQVRRIAKRVAAGHGVDPRPQTEAAKAARRDGSKARAARLNR